MAFANPGEEKVYDSIPLSEVSSVEEINKESSNESNQQQQQEPNSHKSADSAQTRFQNALQIKTDPDGHNGGRTYYLQATSTEQCRSIAMSLALLSRRARKERIGRTKLRRWQGKVFSIHQ